jgi:hypothetical protein
MAAFETTENTTLCAIAAAGGSPETKSADIYIYLPP